MGAFSPSLNKTGAFLPAIIAVSMGGQGVCVCEKGLHLHQCTPMASTFHCQSKILPFFFFLASRIDLATAFVNPTPSPRRNLYLLFVLERCL